MSLLMKSRNTSLASDFKQYHLGNHNSRTLLSMIKVKIYIFFRLCLCLFLVNFEVTVVSTALLSITDNLRDFGRSSWIVTAYLLTYTGTKRILYNPTCFSASH